MGGCGSTQWGIIEHNCPAGQYFDPFSNDCIRSTVCPRECPSKLDNQAACTSDGDLVAGGDCREVRENSAVALLNDCQHGIRKYSRVKLNYILSSIHIHSVLCTPVT